MEGKPGCVYLVGAGCGEADLITLRGLSLLRRCGVVVYDDLIAAELLEEVPREAEAIYAGKRSGRRAMAQEDISALLVRKAQEGRVVVRLKGGDPFVFGRGGEEALALQAAGVLWEAVPGVSSAIAIPGQAGIPVTHRGVSQGVHIVTAHTAGTPDGLLEEFDRLASLPGTLVLLMGLARLDAIVRRLLQAGMSPQTPAAVLSGGNAPRPMAVRGTLADISSRCREVLPPAVIVVGEAAALELDRGRPLHGVTVGLTGTERTADRLRPGLRLLGAEVFRAQRSRVEELETPIPWNLLGDHQNRWLVFTSGNGVERFFRRAQRDRRRRRHTVFSPTSSPPGTPPGTWPGHCLRRSPPRRRSGCSAPPWGAPRWRRRWGGALPSGSSPSTPCAPTRSPPGGPRGGGWTTWSSPAPVGWSFSSKPGGICPPGLSRCASVRSPPPP